MDSRNLAEMALEHGGGSDASAVILELGRAAGWDGRLIRQAMHEVLRVRVSPRSQAALRLLFFAYEQAQRRDTLSLT